MCVVHVLLLLGRIWIIFSGIARKLMPGWWIWRKNIRLCSRALNPSMYDYYFFSESTIIIFSESTFIIIIIFFCESTSLSSVYKISIIIIHFTHLSLSSLLFFRNIHLLLSLLL